MTMPRAVPRRTSCGVLVSDGPNLLIGRAPRSPFWDIPKGGAEAGEAFEEAALRELREETGLRAPGEALRPLGVHAYLRGKDLALFTWRVEAMPDPATLRCTTYFRLPGGGRLPEFDAFAVVAWDEALERVGRNLARVISGLRATPGWPFG